MQAAHGPLSQDYDNIILSLEMTHFLLKYKFLTIKFATEHMGRGHYSYVNWLLTSMLDGV